LKAKILVIHRDYRNRGGEDVFLDEILLPSFKSISFVNPSLTVELLRFGALRFNAFSFSDFFEILFMKLGLEKWRPSYRRALKFIKAGGYSHLILNNFAPTVSLAIPALAQKHNVKILWWLHNSRIWCANGLMFNGRASCSRCLTHGSRWAFFQNCHSNILQSLIYAITYRRNRIPRLVIPHIDLFICNSDFTKRILQKALDVLKLKAKSEVIRMPATSANDEILQTPPQNFLADNIKPFYLFMGRVSFEKGADLFAHMASKYPDKNFVICGDGPMLSQIKNAAAKNLKFVEKNNISERNWLFAHCEALIVSSRVPETSSMVIAESNAFNTPVIYPRGGGAEETFKLLNRIGCALDEFMGQEFEKIKVREENNDRANFLDNLAKILSQIQN
jgi:glycosyltransferase involved in cell wall biosynthesis